MGSEACLYGGCFKPHSFKDCPALASCVSANILSEKLDIIFVICRSRKYPSHLLHTHIDSSFRWWTVTLTIHILHCLRSPCKFCTGMKRNKGEDWNTTVVILYTTSQPTHERTYWGYVYRTPSKPIGYQFVATSTSSPNITVQFPTHACIRVCIHYIMYLFQSLRYLVPLYKWGTNAGLMKLVHL